MSALADHRLAARAGLTLLTANVRFWATIAPLVHAQLKRWEQRARAIPDPHLRALALGKLGEERFNSEVAATLATLAPRAHRPQVVEAIVAYEVMYDYLDGLTERPAPNQIATGLNLYRAFIDAVTTGRSPRGDDYYPSGQSDGGYLKELSEAVSGAFAQLPAREAVTTVAARAAHRCAQAQVRAHSIPAAGETQLRQWALNEATSTSLGWQAFLAGSAASVLSVHALIAAAANPRTTVEVAETIDSAYLSIGSVSTILDSLTDYEQDRKTGGHNFLSYYEDQAHISADLSAATGLAINETQRLADGPHHLMILTGVAAYYCSAPSASEGFARPIARQLCRELQPVVTPTLAVMRTWRAAKTLRRRGLKHQSSGEA